MLRVHANGGPRTLRIRNGTGTIVATQSINTVPGNDYVLTANYFQLGGAGSLAICEVFPVNYFDVFPEAAADAQITLQTLTWFGNTIETVTGVRGAVGPGANPE